jgi:hypothetical protein
MRQGLVGLHIVHPGPARDGVTVAERLVVPMVPSIAPLMVQLMQETENGIENPPLPPAEVVPVTVEGHEGVET